MVSLCADNEMMVNDTLLKGGGNLAKQSVRFATGRDIFLKKIF